jgi:hypothetical protein
MVAILNAGGYLSADDTPIVNNAIYTPTNTFFAPNTQTAVDTFTSLAPSMSQDQLAGIFNYHVVPDFLAYSPQLTDEMQLRTSQGTNLTITVQGNTTFVNGARIITYDYLVCNGVVHMIDRYVSVHPPFLPTLHRSTRYLADHDYLSILNPSNTTGPPPLPSPTAYTAANNSSSSSTDSTSKATWTLASKAEVGVGAFLILVFLSGATYFIIRFLQNRKSSSKNRRAVKSKVIWNVGPAWAKKVAKEIVKERWRGRTVPSPQELDAEEKSRGKGDERVMSPGVSEASTVREYSGTGRSRQSSWGGELDGNAKHYAMRGHQDEI